MFETERCLINSLENVVKKIYVNPNVRKYLGGIRQGDSINAVLDEIINLEEGSFHWVVRETITDDFICLVSFDLHHERSYQLTCNCKHRKCKMLLPTHTIYDNAK